MDVRTHLTPLRLHWQAVRQSANVCAHSKDCHHQHDAGLTDRPGRGRSAGAGCRCQWPGARVSLRCEENFRPGYQQYQLPIQYYSIICAAMQLYALIRFQLPGCSAFPAAESTIMIQDPPRTSDAVVVPVSSGGASVQLNPFYTTNWFEPLENVLNDKFGINDGGPVGPSCHGQWTAALLCSSATG